MQRNYSKYANACVECGKAFEAVMPNSRFCSSGCRSKAFRAQRNVDSENRPATITDHDNALANGSFVAQVESFLRDSNERRLMAKLEEEREEREDAEAQIVRLQQRINDLQVQLSASRLNKQREASRPDALVENVITLISRFIPPAKH
jgi:hypothetical protein